MSETKYRWYFSSKPYFEHYEANVGKDVLNVFRRADDDRWFGTINGKLIYDKTANDRQREKQGFPKGAPASLLKSPRCLSSSSSDRMKCKVEWCYANGRLEVSR